MEPAFLAENQAAWIPVTSTGMTARTDEKYKKARRFFPGLFLFVVFELSERPSDTGRRLCS